MNKEKRVRQAVREYLGCASILSAKLNKSLLELCDQSVDPKAWKTLAYYHGMLDKHIDLVDHRLLQNQSIPAAEKVYSLFEPHTEWIQTANANLSVELGQRLLVASDQHQLIHDYHILEGAVDIDQSIPVADLLLSDYGEGEITSMSFDKGFSRMEDRELLRLYIPEMVMPNAARKIKNKCDEKAARHLLHYAGNIVPSKVTSTPSNTTGSIAAST